MKLLQRKHPGYTLKDWQSLEGRWKLINDETFDRTPAPSTEHKELFSNLHGYIMRCRQGS